MNMNIYITEDNEKYLRTQKSMSGLINRLLDDYRKDSAKVSPMEAEAEKVVKNLPKPQEPAHVNFLKKK